MKDIPRRIPALIVYLHPFRIIESDESGTWSTNISQINNRGWDFEQLHKLVGGLDVGLCAPYHLAVGFDGALALPPIPELRNHQKAVEFFNKCLAAILIGGIYCEAVNLDSLQLGTIIDWKYIRVHKAAKSADSVFHNLIRLQMCPPIEAISLLNPKITKYADLYEAMQEGMTLLSKVPNLSPEFLLKGVSGIARLDWTAALSNLWVVVEQLVNHFWEEKIIKAISSDIKVEGRKTQLSDPRTWTIANRVELLFQKEIFALSTMEFISIARKGRNDLLHKGFHVREEAAYGAYNAIIKLLELINEVPFALTRLNLKDHSLSDPFTPPESRDLNPTYWMHIPKLPGEAELEREEAEFRKTSNK